MFSTDFIFRQQENLVDNQKCQSGFRPLCNKIRCLCVHDQCFHCTVIWLYNKKKISWAVVKRISRSSLIKYYGMYILKRKANTRSTNTDHKHFLMPQLILYAP